jgi:hypothetical protein
MVAQQGTLEPTLKKNGVAEPQGDIGNFTADANGNGTISFNYR